MLVLKSIASALLFLFAILFLQWPYVDWPLEGEWIHGLLLCCNCRSEFFACFFTYKLFQIIYYLLVGSLALSSGFILSYLILNRTGDCFVSESIAVIYIKLFNFLRAVLLRIDLRCYFAFFLLFSLHAEQGFSM